MYKACIRADVTEPMKGASHEELQQHKERVKEKLEGLVTTIDKIPSIITAENAQVRRCAASRAHLLHRCFPISAAMVSHPPASLLLTHMRR
jgi:hypothetical protein